MYFPSPRLVDVVGEVVLLEVPGVIGDSASQFWNFGALDVDVLEQDLHLGFWWGIGLSLGGLLVNVLSSSLVVRLDFLFSGNVLVQEDGLQTGNRVVSGSHVLNFLSGSVSGTWVGHGVTTVSVGLVLQNQWTVTARTPVLGELGGSVAGQDVHTVNLQTWNVLTSLVVLGHGRGSGSRSTHTVLVVLTSKDTWQVPQLSHVVRFENLTLVGSTVTVQGESGTLVVSVLVGKGQTSAQWNSSTDNTVTTVEAWSKHVHGTTLTVRNTRSLTHQLTQDTLDRGTSHVGETVTSVGSDDSVGWGNGIFNTNSDGFSTHRQVTETSNFLGLVQSVGGHLHSSDDNHVLVHLQQGFLFGLEGQFRSIDVVCLKGRSG
ncbi:hypothetical protein CLUG_02988 [Clavispora lusitaniae ATCC 42720]|uniref:Uncharacterized protein n=1 Tax=Clavispora lusitaniae (strain ATCC 42720) TaxID=306902 RepID=C4Y375_CLAL4|nr:uncharacterized protein CLUG_02988 [Clavispora lusitaniae ATCC 42720]EEQ38862.1 hypothetical protein CLUG_02988 [Clavispora lusitaniae ATCC 42720]